MINEIGFGLIDNGILVGGAIFGFSIENWINIALENLLRQTKYKLATRVKGLSGALIGGGVGNSISDFLGGWCVNWQLAVGSGLGCVLVVIIALPFIFKLEQRG